MNKKYIDYIYCLFLERKRKMILDLNSENVMKYIGYAVVIVFIIYILIKLANLQMNVVEGLSLMGDDDKDKKKSRKNKDDDKPSSLANLETFIESMQEQIEKDKDSLLIDKYRDTYEDLIMTADEALDYKIIKSISNFDAFHKSDNFNNMFTLKQNLAKAMEILDSK